ncbi:MULTISPECIES: cell wall-binding protein [unclassified Clostridium]|uniref:cell wall-binding protein n=1 Tax=unclassified Clostridium TaxID=2614128 RepID=UPI000298108D|nr:MULTISPECIES: cell wall-binding protein [unclassified Clostridium]EKQ58138.1 MAG: putative cell wall binding protein [Clostridium sp. Maddingley MBC34-26]
MSKKIIPLLMILGVTIQTFVPNVAAYADNRDYYVNDNSKFLGQTIPSTGKEHGWYKFPDGGWGYYIDYGKLVKNVWINEADGDYGIGSDGKMVKGWFKNSIDNKWYYFQSDGKANKGWLQSDGLWYYMDNTGAMLTGWQQINQRWYYFNPKTGVMAVNIKVDGYYLSGDGSLQ